MKLITPSTLEPLTLEEAKAHLQVFDGDDDAYINTLIKVARRVVEGKVGIQIMPATYEAVVPDFNHPFILKGPVKEIESITYLNEYGATQTLTNIEANESEGTAAINYYWLDTYSYPHFIGFDRQLAPAVSYTPYAIKVRFKAGFDEVPEDIKQAMLLIIGTLYENRQEEVTGISVARISFGVDALLAPYVVYA